jgi:hypothetical protein
MYIGRQPGRYRYARFRRGKVSRPQALAARYPEARNMRPDTKLMFFVLLVFAIFLGAYQAGSIVGPVAPANAPAGPAGSGGGSNMGGMNMAPARP